jgi:hypothetical protein
MPTGIYSYDNKWESDIKEDETKSVWMRLIQLAQNMVHILAFVK